MSPSALRRLMNVYLARALSQGAACQQQQQMGISVLPSTHLRLLACTALPLCAAAFSLSILRVLGRVATGTASLLRFILADVVALPAARRDTPNSSDYQYNDIWSLFQVQ